MPNRYKCILLFGAPGSGKGTQGKVLGTVPGYFHCACGDVFRNIDIHSEVGKVFYDYSSRGKLVPDDITVKIWQEAIHSRTVTNEYKPKLDMLILDGIPRTRDQAAIMDKYIDVLQVVHLVCKDVEAMFERLRRRALKDNRHDDADEKVIRHRWEIYQAETQPVLDHYPPDRVAEVNAVNSPTQVLRDTLDIVMPIQDAHFVQFEG